MKYLITLLLILGLAGCRQQVADFDDSFNVIEQNLNLVNKYNKAREEIGIIRERVEEYNKQMVDQENDEIGDSSSQTPPASQATPTTPAVIIPEEFNLPVKFASQAPFAIWDELHKEACEEAAMIIAARYLKGEDLNKEIMETGIQALVRWEEENEYAIDVTAQETAEILKNYFGLKAEKSDEVTIERIKKELALGNLVITSHAGRQLGNPYYRQPGPLYHFLVIRGWTKDEFITNDPGTKRGEGYKYKFDKLIETVHDWNKGEVDTGPKAMIIVYK